MSIVGRDWFTEIYSQAGSAFSLQIEACLHEEQTPYQTIAIYQTTQFGKLMVIDGYTMVSSRDNFIYHEMMAHPVLFTHPGPRRVCIIGGGDCGTLREVLLHPNVERALLVEIDERVTRLAERFFPELTASNGDPRASLRFEDAVEWIARAEPGSLDVIIVDSTDPIGPGKGLFGETFYANCLRALDKGGMLVHQSESPLYHMELMHRMYEAMRGAGFADLKTLFFPQPIYPSGWWSATMACKDGPLPPFNAQAVDGKTFETSYYNAAIHQAALAEPEFFRRTREGWTIETKTRRS